MRIIYDSKKPSHERVIVENGKKIVGCFDLKIELTTADGKPHSQLHFSRWGNQKERDKTHKAVHNASIRQHREVDDESNVR